MDIGHRIKERRELLGMSQDELAKKVGYKSRSSINKIESDGRGLPQSKIVAFAKALETTPAYLMGWELSDEEIGEVFYQNMLRDPEKKSRHQSPSHAETVFIDMVRSILEEELKKEQLDALNKRIKERLPKDFGMPKSTLAAHFDGDEYTEDELDEIRQFAEFVKSKRES